MSEAEDIVTWIVGDTDLAAFIDQRVYPLRLPASPDFPAITWQLVSEGQDPMQEGPGLAEPRYRFRIWTRTYIELEPIARALKAAFNGRHDGPFRSSFVDNSFEDYDQKIGRYWRIVDVLGWQPSEPEVIS